MRHRPLGRSGLKISALTLGTYLTVGERLDEAAALALIRTAFELGISTFDTADGYAGGAAERLLGCALEELGRRHCVVATKCYFPQSGSPNDRGLSRKHLVDSVHESLRRLRTDYLDLMQCHRFDAETPLEETVATMDLLTRQGKVLHWGVSRWTAPQLREGVAVSRHLRAFAPLSCQSPYHLLFREAEVEGTLAACAELGMGFLAYAPLAQGVLTGKYTHGIPAGSRADSGRRAAMHQLGTGELRRAASLELLAREAGMTLAQLALAWVLREGGATAAVVGATSRAQLEENVRACEVRLEPALLARIEAALAPDAAPPMDQHHPARTPNHDAPLVADR